MNNRHYLFLTISLIIIVSIFLYSCGIPTFCSLNNIKITSKNNNSFCISGVNEDINLISIGPGMLICYVIGDTSINNNEIISEFSNQAKTKININSDNLILTSKNHSLYAFSNINNDLVSSIKSPLYNVNLNSYIDHTSNSINSNFRLYNYNWKENEFKIDIIDDSTENVIQNLFANTENKEGNYIHIFVAFSAEVGDFNNHYWSNLTYIGSISK